VVTTNAASGVTSSGATLNGSVNPGGPAPPTSSITARPPATATRFPHLPGRRGPAPPR
jgi:hypothetical protein